MNLHDASSARPLAFLALAGVSVLLNVYLLVGGQAAEPAPEPLQEAAAIPDSEPVPTVAAADVPSEGALPVDAIAPLEVLPVPEAPPGITVLKADVEHSLARTFQTADAARGDVLSAIYSRLFVARLDMRSDLQKGDRVRMAYTWDGQLADIEAASFHSRKLDQTFSAFRFHATGDAFPTWWDADALEAVPRLKNGPINDYEQITSLLKDRPSHKGMDFKTPVGTPILTPKAGSVVRTDWNFKYNGNCIEVQYDDGTTARFLHLSETGVKPGARVKAGQVIGKSGNTGRSTAPHLHYELEKAGKVIDPLVYHGTEHRSLPAGDRAAFEAKRASLSALIEG